MLVLLRKEINGFFHSLMGYIVITVFLVTLGLFLWVFPSTGFNIIENGYADINGLFVVAPWVFMFLIPAITMRLFAEEKKTGTIELLFTLPLSDFQIITAKYLAGFALVLLSLLPTLIYYVSVYLLAVPVGNIDNGGIIGSYIGLLFLSGGFVAIGIFASSTTDNQIVAFIIAVFLSFFCYIGFDSIGSFELFGKSDIIIQMLSMNTHYLSMSRGVLDTRDIVYFLSITGLFLLLTKNMLQSRKW